jgi:hypothetical protein
VLRVRQSRVRGSPATPAKKRRDAQNAKAWRAGVLSRTSGFRSIAPSQRGVHRSDGAPPNHCSEGAPPERRSPARHCRTALVWRGRAGPLPRIVSAYGFRSHR